MSYNAKLSALECSLQQSIANYKDIVKDFENLCFESEDYKMKFINQKEKCESKSCCGSEAFKKTIETKDNIIQQVALVLSKLYETKNFNIINEAFKLICGDATSHLKMELPKDKCDTEKLTVKIEMNTPKKELSDFIQDVSYKEESSSEIEGTPGRTSPIIQSKKQRNGITNKSSDNRDKKKCPDNWPTPENKVVKLIYPTPSRSRANGKLRQTRFSVVKLRTSNVVDLTSSPELMSARASHEDCKPLVQQLVKKESTDNDDTILPSPTSGPPKYPSLLKNTCKSSPFKKPPLSLKPKLEIKLDPNENVENSPTINFKCVDANDESINLLKPIRSKEMKENSPKKEHSIDYDETNCEIASSLSILQRVDMMEQHQEHNDKTPSPKKRPLEANINLCNVPEVDTDASMSLLRREPTFGKPSEEKLKRNLPECAEPVYKEPTLRKKMEKRALPGWSCEQCRIFYDELYKDDLEMLAKKMDECSKHRGRNNPGRPKTPDGFWNPRWDVPDDTEEFNRRNNAV